MKYETGMNLQQESYNGTSAAIRDAALDLFSTQSYSSVTIKRIAEVSGVNPSLIYYYFGNKEELFITSIEHVIDSAFQHFDSTTFGSEDPAAVISGWLDLHVDYFSVLQKIARVSLDHAMTGNVENRLKNSINRFYDKERVILESVISDSVKNKLIVDVDAARLSETISTFLDGSLFRNLIFSDFDYARSISFFKSIILSHLNLDAPGPRAGV